MSTLTKSPLRVAREALAVASRRLRCYAHKFSPKKFTQPQLFACLVVKAFLKTDYRGLVAHLADHSELRGALGLKTVPHFTTPHKAGRRLLRQRVAKRLFRITVRRFLQRQRRLKRAALDSTGLDCGHASRHYIRRRNGFTKQWQRVSYSTYAKLEAAFDCDSHLMVAVLTGRGPRPDTDRFVPLLDATCQVASTRHWPTPVTIRNPIIVMHATAAVYGLSFQRRLAGRRPNCHRLVIAVA